MDQITSLCKQYTDLTDQEIAMIAGMSGMLQPLANLEDADIFIDCPTRDGDAIVVAEAKPEDAPSSYKLTVVGLLAETGERTGCRPDVHAGRGDQAGQGDHPGAHKGTSSRSNRLKTVTA